MALANKLSDHRSEISDAIGLQEIYLSDQLSNDFDTTGEISLQEGSIMPGFDDLWHSMLLYNSMF